MLLSPSIIAQGHAITNCSIDLVSDQYYGGLHEDCMGCECITSLPYINITIAVTCMYGQFSFILYRC